MVWILIVLLGLLPRELTYAAQAGLTEDPAWYVDVDGGLDLRKLLSACQTFFREHSEHWSQRFQYQEAWPQLLLQAFLHRIVNGGGRIELEYGLGRGRTDLLIVWPRRGGKSGAGRSRAGGHRVGGGEAARVDEIVIECKVLHGSLERTISEGPGADGSVHGPLRGGGRPSRGHRPRAGEALGREGVPAPDDVTPRRRHRRVGHVRTPGRAGHLPLPLCICGASQPTSRPCTAAASSIQRVEADG